MKISKVLNNNCVSMLDDNDNEMILYGNGIGYSKKPGQEVDKTKISKTFVMKDKDKLEIWRQLLKRVPDEIIELSENIIENAQEQFDNDLNGAIHVALPDHIYGAIENFKEGIILNNAVLLEIKKFYPEEYKLGAKALEELNQHSGIMLPEDEAGFIAMHIVNARGGMKNPSAKAVVIMVNEMEAIIRQVYGKELELIDENSLIYCRYLTHLKFFAQRVITKTFHSDEEFTLDEITKKYRKEYRCSCMVCDFIEKKYQYHSGTDEKMYLAVHLIQIGRKK